MDNDTFDLILQDTLSLLKGMPAPPPIMAVKEPLPPPIPAPPTPPAPPKQEPVVIKPVPKPIALEVPKPITPPPSSIESLVRKTAPQLKILHDIPSDEKARRVKEAYRSQQNIPEIPILYSDPKDRPFLSNVSKGIETAFASSHPLEVTFFEKERTWDFFLKTPHLKLILIPDMVLWNSLDLMRYYKEIPSSGIRTLGNLPLLLIADPKLYQTDPNLKRSLWLMIKNLLKSSLIKP